MSTKQDILITYIIIKLTSENNEQTKYYLNKFVNNKSKEKNLFCSNEAMASLTIYTNNKKWIHEIS